jgi:predicted nucleic acid-binding Zn ribbon protein
MAEKKEKEAVFSRKALEALQEWRLLPNKKRERPEQTVGGRVHLVLKGLGLEEQFNEQELTGAWREVVGDYLAENSRPGAIRRGTLEIMVLQPSILFMLERDMKSVVLKKLQTRFGAERIRKVRFRVG